MAADNRFATIGLMGPATDLNVADTMTQLAQHLLSLGRRVIVEPEVAACLPLKLDTASEAEMVAGSQLVITIGGDGTMLRAARMLAGSDTPLVGVNRGRLGFLADISPKDAIRGIDAVLAGNFVSGARALLEVRLISAGGDAVSTLAINDCVLQKWETGRMLDYETWIDGKYVNTHGGDGVIVASATGSTAYALSCGGPIIHPSLDAMVIAPISPHTLSDRPIVVPGSSMVEIRRVQDRAKAQVTCDGALLGDLALNDRLLIAASNLRVNLLHPLGYDYYRILRSKLHWGRGALEKRIIEDGDE